MEDIERQYRKRGEQLKFPNSIGLTGQAFQSGEIVYSNNMGLTKNFQPFIDNFESSVEVVYQIAVVPVYGHRRHLNGEDIENLPIAVIQLINKANMKPIDKYDLQKIDAMRDLFGRAIDNAAEHHSVISCRVGMTDGINDMNKKYGSGGPLEE